MCQILKMQIRVRNKCKHVGKIISLSVGVKLENTLKMRTLLQDIRLTDKYID